MKTIRKVGVLLGTLFIVAALAVGFVAPVVAQMPVFSPFSGTVTIDSVAAPIGTVVDAYVGTEATPRDTATTTTAGWYEVALIGTSEDVGKPVTFMVDGFVATSSPATPLYAKYSPQTVGLAVNRDEITWNFPLGNMNLIAPHPTHGRPFLTLAVDPADITVSAGAELWGIYYPDETTGVWLYYVPGFTDNTLTQLEPDEFYLVAVSDTCTLTLPYGP